MSSSPLSGTLALSLRPRQVAVAITAAVVLAVLLAVPAFLNAYWMRILSTIFMYAVIAQGINLMAGYTGYPAFGNVVFFGLGGYATGILMLHLKFTFLWAAVAGTLLCPLVALLVGPPLLRLKGHYFAIATLGLNEAVKEIVLNASPLTGGGIGMSLPLPPGNPAQASLFFYFVLLGLMLASTWIVWEFRRRRIGLGSCAVRDNEEKAESNGLYTVRYKTLTWMISAAMTGAVGCVNAYWLTYITAPSVFDMAIAVKGFLIFLLGGAATVLGPVAGAFLVEAIATFTWSALLDWHTGAMGIVIMLVILLFPNGMREAFRAR